MCYKKIQFSLNSLNSILKIGFYRIDKELLKSIVLILLKLDFRKINIHKSRIEINCEPENEYVIFILRSHRRIPIDITIHKYGMDFLVAENQAIYEMFEIGDIKLNYLKRWFTTKIINKIKQSEGIIVYSKFYNKCDEKDVLFFNRSFFNFLYFNKYEEIEYDSWMYLE